MAALTRDELIDELQAHGFRMGEAASKKWRVALARSVDRQTLVVLLRARGVDLLLTPLTIGEMVNPEGKLSVSMHREGDRFVEYFYTDSEAPVHDQALSVASMFTNKLPIDDSYFQKVGISRSEFGAKLKAEANADGGGSMTDVYKALGNDDGEPVYLSDGVWLTADGSTYDERP